MWIRLKRIVGQAGNCCTFPPNIFFSAVTSSLPKGAGNWVLEVISMLTTGAQDAQANLGLYLSSQRDVGAATRKGTLQKL